ncbi:MAG: Trehalose synthase, partial [Myxococcaceae bacterium]|nr:Trehalose synthase [Myxococcaceae bacterium]
DLHLGQVLREEGEWRIFDFEGEPGRALQQRREKQTPLKDVAALLRSLGYAAAVSERAGKPVPAFAGKARKAFLDGYLASVEGTDLLPSGRGDAMALLHAMELEKALYEVRYEMSNRPDWADIPVAVLLEGAP